MPSSALHAISSKLRSLFFSRHPRNCNKQTEESDFDHKTSYRAPQNAYEMDRPTQVLFRRASSCFNWNCNEPNCEQFFDHRTCSRAHRKSVELPRSCSGRAPFIRWSNSSDSGSNYSGDNDDDCSWITASYHSANSANPASADADAGGGGADVTGGGGGGAVNEYEGREAWWTLPEFKYSRLTGPDSQEQADEEAANTAVKGRSEGKALKYTLKS